MVILMWIKLKGIYINLDNICLIKAERLFMKDGTKLNLEKEDYFKLTNFLDHFIDLVTFNEKGGES